MNKHLDPRLVSLMERAEGMRWLFVKNLQKGDVLEVQTQNTLYMMKVLDPENGKVLAKSDGKHITQETECEVGGSSLTGTGTMMKVGGIAVGLRLVLFVRGHGEFLLSATREVKVNGTKVLP